MGFVSKTPRFARQIELPACDWLIGCFVVVDSWNICELSEEVGESFEEQGFRAFIDLSKTLDHMSDTLPVFCLPSAAHIGYD